MRNHVVQTAFSLPDSLAGMRVYMVGIKGAGMTALAELLAAGGATVRGWDVVDRFFTDTILDALGLQVDNEPDPQYLRTGVDVVVYSAAYDPALHPQLIEAQRLALPILSYPQALGAFSARTHAIGICGVHGKTTTTAMVGSVMRALGWRGSVLVGSAVPQFDGRCTWVGGDGFFVAETCEYRRHFLNFHPQMVLLTNVEADHLDYFAGYDDIRDAFVSYLQLLPVGGTVIFCATDAGACDVVARVAAARNDLRLVPYGAITGDLSGAGHNRLPNPSTGAAWRFSSVTAESGRYRCVTSGSESIPRADLRLQVPGRHNVTNAVGAAALLWELARFVGAGAAVSAAPELMASIASELSAFKGTKRRCELVANVAGITVVDDFAHHPTAIMSTLAGLKEFYPGRRLVVDFMSHTYSRTRALLTQFASALAIADEIILHNVYPSAREQHVEPLDGTVLVHAVQSHGKVTHYIPSVDAAAGPNLSHILSVLHPGDVFVTMGAGDNWRIGHAVAGYLSGKTG